MKPQVKKWLEFAGIDLLSAEKLLSDERVTQSAAFHCHQAIEKSLKALLEELGIKIPRIHDLERLYGIMIENDIELNINLDVLDQINDVYIDSRYPTDVGLIPAGTPSIKKVEDFYKLAKSIKNFVTEKIEKNPL